MTERTVPGARITALHTYPVKGCRGLAHTAQTLTHAGLAWDRHWMFISDAGRFLTQRECPGLARIDAVVTVGELRLRSHGHPELRCPFQAEGSRREVTVWRDRCLAQVSNVDTRDWLESVTGTRGQLVRSLPGDERTSAREFTGADVASVRFADAYALLLTNEASLEDLNARLDRPLPMSRFRPNLVLQGLKPYAEDEIDRIRIGDIELRCVKPCTRCIVTTTDQSTGERDGDEPLRTLREYRWLASLSGVAFGINAIVVKGDGKSLHVGDHADIDWRVPGAPRPW
jgi:MOSC domain-containing protein